MTYGFFTFILSFTIWYLSFQLSIQNVEALDWNFYSPEIIPLTDLKCEKVSSEKVEVDVDFYFFTENSKIKIFSNHGNESKTGCFDVLLKNGFCKSRKTVFITTGFFDNDDKKWLEDIAQSFYDQKEYNVIMVDWSVMSKNLKYHELALSAPSISFLVMQFFKMMKSYVQNNMPTQEDIHWNRLYFIGHSIGAHVVGDAANLLKSDTFWHVDRITGLDPAKPCFVEVQELHKLNKNDAKFVDVIHTNAGTTQKSFSFGLNEPLGHIDFYVNGGRQQPKCMEKEFPLNEMCSHSQATSYYAESLKKKDECMLSGLKWNGKKESAIELFKKRVPNFVECSKCPKLGIQAKPVEDSTTFLVYTHVIKSFCDNYDSKDEVKTVIKNLLYQASFN